MEKYFYKHLNNSNFGNDCQNNIGNCKLELMFDGLEDLLTLKNIRIFLQTQNLENFFDEYSSRSSKRRI